MFEPADLAAGEHNGQAAVLNAGPEVLTHYARAAAAQMAHGGCLGAFKVLAVGKPAPLDVRHLDRNDIGRGVKEEIVRLVEHSAPEQEPGGGLAFGLALCFP